MLSKVHVERMLYDDRPSLDTLPINSNAYKYRKLVPLAYESFRTLHTTKHALWWMKKIPNLISIDPSTSVLGAIKHPRRLYASKASSEQEETLHQADSKWSEKTLSKGSKSAKWIGKSFLIARRLLLRVKSIIPLRAVALRHYWKAAFDSTNEITPHLLPS